MKITTNRTQEINRLHNEVCMGLKTIVEKAIRIGKLLVEQKAECNHGEWLPWLKANVKFSERTARNYMRLYSRRDEIKSATVADLNMRQLYGYAVKPSKEELIEKILKEKSAQEKLYEKVIEMASKRLKKLEEAKKIIEIEEDSQLESDFEDEDEDEEENLQKINSDSEYIKKTLESIELSLDGEKLRESEKGKNISAKQVRLTANGFWQEMCETYDEADQIKMAKLVIEMLRKKYNIQ